MPVDTSKWNKMIWDQKLKSVEGLGLTAAARKLNLPFYKLRYQREVREKAKAATPRLATIEVPETSLEELLITAIVARPDLARRVALAYLQNGHAPK